MIPDAFGEGRLLTIDEVAKLTGLAVGTLYHFVSQKRIPVVRLSKRCIRFRQSDLSHWIQTLTQENTLTITKKENPNVIKSEAKGRCPEN